MRWTCTLCLALLTLPALASAQADEEEEAIALDDDDAMGPGPFWVSDEPPPDDGSATTGTGTTRAEPVTSSGSVVVDDRAAALRREQAAMVAGYEDDVEEEEEEQEESESLDHEYQLGIRGGAGVPFFFGLRYNDGPRCSDQMNSDGTEATFCYGVGSGIVDFDISFGITPDVEIVALGRIGMARVTPTNDYNVQIGLGIRAYISPESLFKVYLAPAVILDLTPSGVEPDWGEVDFGVRGAFGLQLDFVRYAGLWIELGVNILFLRSFGIGPYASGGFQVRFP